MADMQQRYATSPGRTTCTRGGCDKLLYDGLLCRAHRVSSNPLSERDRLVQPESPASPHSTPRSSEKKAKRSKPFFAPISKPAAAPVDRAAAATVDPGSAPSPTKAQALPASKHQYTHSPSALSSDSRFRGSSHPRTAPLQSTSNGLSSHQGHNSASETLPSLYQLSSTRHKPDSLWQFQVNSAARLGRAGPLSTQQGVTTNGYHVTEPRLSQNNRSVSSPLPVESKPSPIRTSHSSYSGYNNVSYRDRVVKGARLANPNNIGFKYEYIQRPQSGVVIDLTADDPDVSSRAATNTNGLTSTKPRVERSTTNITLPGKPDLLSYRDPARHPLLINQPTVINAERPSTKDDLATTEPSSGIAHTDPAGISRTIDHYPNPPKRKAHLLSQNGPAETNGAVSPAAIENAFGPRVNDILSSVIWTNRDPDKRNGRSDQTASPKFARDAVRTTNGSRFVSAAENDRRARVAQFDSVAFDSQLYAQEGALPPPVGVHVNWQQGENSLRPNSEAQYLYVDPSIHGTHNRSGDWHRRKAIEIQQRPRRKAWFGKVIERQRWLSRQRTAAAEERASAGLLGAPLRKDPEPWTHDVPVDFADVAEEDLPEDVREDPTWLSICARFRQDRAMKEKKESTHGRNWRARKVCSNGDTAAHREDEETPGGQQDAEESAHSRRVLEAEQQAQEFFRELKHSNSLNYLDNLRRHRAGGYNQG